MKRTPGWIAALPSLVVPVCFGLSLYLGLQYLIDQKVIADETVLRYLTGHPVSNITVGMFLVGMCSVMLIGWNLFQQFAAEGGITLDGAKAQDREASETQNDVADLAVDHAQHLLGMPGRYQGHYLWERLVNAVHSIYRTGSTSNVEEELKYLSDIDVERQQQRYSLVRILIWATPMLGFLGTVLGISQALGGIAVGPDNDFQQMMDGLTGNLYIAFDTTALALTLSMAMMFAAFFAERFESQLLRLVDQRARSEVARHYELAAFAGGTSGSKEVVEAIQEVVENQTDIWRNSIRKAEQAWTASLTQTNDLVRSNLTDSLDENVAALAHYLGEAIEKADASMSQRWSQWQVGLSANARLMERHMVLLAEQTASVTRVVNALDDSTGFETALKHQQDAIDATTRTHDVLSQLLNQAQSSGVKDPDPDSMLVSGSELPLPVVHMPLPDVLVDEIPMTAEPASVEAVEEIAVSSDASEKPEIRIFDEDKGESQGTDGNPDSEADAPSPQSSAEDLEPVNPVADQKDVVKLPEVIVPPKPDSNSAKVLKAVGGLVSEPAKIVLHDNEPELSTTKKDASQTGETETTPPPKSDVIFRDRPGNRRAA